jgi:mycothiol system anti-sigma-R factor
MGEHGHDFLGSDPCGEALDHLFAYIDRELPDDELRHIAEHLSECPPCEAERRIQERIKSIIAECPHENAPDDLRQRVAKIVEDARAAGGAA